MKAERKKLVKKLDLLCRKILLIRDLKYGKFFRCISCHQLLDISKAQVGHYISRRYESVRWDLRNISLQCAACNHWKSGNVIEYRKSLIEIYGEKEIEKMEALYRESPHYSVFDLEQLVKKYKQILSEYEGGAVDNL